MSLYTDIESLQDTKLWAIWSYEHKGWWRAARNGYTQNRSEAGYYSEIETNAILAEANTHSTEPKEGAIRKDFVKQGWRP